MNHLYRVIITHTDENYVGYNIEGGWGVGFPTRRGEWVWGVGFPTHFFTPYNVILLTYH
jgi:hypothetical protein